MMEEIARLSATLAERVRARVRLPFEGDNALALILSKAFLLADDDKIKAPSIVSQIRRS